MQILIDLTASRSGRLAGTVQPAPNGRCVSFSGILELLACIEHLVQPDTPASDDSLVTKVDAEH